MTTTTLESTSLLPVKHNFSCYQGESWSRTLTLTDNNDDPIDLSLYTVYMRIVDRAGGTLFKAISTASGITVNSSGEIGLAISKTDTALIPAGTWYYDIFVVDSYSSATPLVSGDWVQSAKA